ncbi:hypothetical protein HPB52_005494 [Rhipicephalus sanguineus]|uniref:Uncharacterized protein n=1 Tax=Rhipicephalus sanguineus TaxID=34632 RepID=A0A9D4QFI9_RHISA|nr:hypothetical protein HPB52_005494 [Rhipicephalus sanguineus]
MRATATKSFMLVLAKRPPAAIQESCSEPEEVSLALRQIRLPLQDMVEDEEFASVVALAMAADGAMERQQSRQQHKPRPSQIDQLTRDLASKPAIGIASQPGPHHMRLPSFSLPFRSLLGRRLCGVGVRSDDVDVVAAPSPAVAKTTEAAGSPCTAQEALRHGGRTEADDIRLLATGCCALEYRSVRPGSTAPFLLNEREERRAQDPDVSSPGPIVEREDDLEHAALAVLDQSYSGRAEMSAELVEVWRRGPVVAPMGRAPSEVALLGTPNLAHCRRHGSRTLEAAPPKPPLCRFRELDKEAGGTRGPPLRSAEPREESPETLEGPPAHLVDHDYFGAAQPAMQPRPARHPPQLHPGRQTPLRQMHATAAELVAEQRRLLALQEQLLPHNEHQWEAVLQRLSAVMN